MSQVNHITNVRPGDRWDGVALNIHKTSFDWSQAQVTVQLRLGVRGPLVANIAFSQSTAVDTLVLGFYLTAADTAKLRLGSTYYGTVTVQIPNANPALEPTFGPYTLFTWAMEMSDRAQSGSETYTVEFGSSTVFNISLNEGSTITISGGGDGSGSGAPSAHAATHKHGGSDEVATGTPSANAIPKADANGKLDTWVSSGAAAGTPSLRALGTGALQACAGNDGRLADARTPLAHTHPVGEVTGLGGAATLNVGSSAGTVCAGNDGRLSDSRTPTAHAASHKHGGADEVAVATPAANAIPKADGAGKLDAWITSSGAAATPSLRILGTAATDACAGNDGRLSNARTPTAHTHTSSEITDFNESVDDRVGALLVAGSNITITYNDAGNSLTIASTAGGGVATDSIWTAAGDIVVGTGSSASARVGLGARGARVGSDGVTTKFLEHRQHFTMFDDFFTSPSGWTFIGGSNVGTRDGSTTGPGSIYVKAAGSVNQASVLYSAPIFFGGGTYYLEWRVQILVLSTPSERFTVRVGFLDSHTPTDGCYFECVDNVNSGQWQFKVTGSGSTTTGNSSVAATTGWVRVGVLVNAAATQVDFFIDGTNVGNLTGVNIPTSSEGTSIGFAISKSVGAGDSYFNADYYYLDVDLTTPR